MNPGDENNNLKRKHQGATKFCCVPFCKSVSYNDKFGPTNICFYRFPDESSDLITHRCWLREIRKSKAEVGESFKNTLDAFVCECHFRNDDFAVSFKNGRGRKVLRHGSVPQLFKDNKKLDASSDESDVEVVDVHPVAKQDKQVEEINEGLAEKQSKLREYQLSVLKEKIGHQKESPRQKLLIEKEEQEEKLRQLLVQQEEHKRQVKVKSKLQQQQQQQLANQVNKAELDRLRKLKQLQELEEQQKHLKEVQSQMKSKKETTKPLSGDPNDKNTSLWKHQKESLQQMLEQQKVRLAEIQKQESLYDVKKRKRALDHELMDKSMETSTCTSKNTAASINVISCGRCLKLEAELEILNEKYEQIKKENELLQRMKR